MSADNQQERLDSYIAGYVDGEGSFHVAVQRAQQVRFGYQLVPEFQISQNFDYANTLTVIRKRLDCGYIKPNHAKNLRDNSYIYVVRARQDLLHKIIPFFERNNLLSPKQKDFEKFADIVKAMDRKIHFDKEGFITLLEKAFTMNRGGLYRKLDIAQIVSDLESSTTIR